MKLIGIIKEIKTEEIFKKGKGKLVAKEVVILKMDNNQTASIQFQGIMRNKLTSYKENQEVIIDIEFKGQRTPLRFYDNIVATNISKLT